jgi:adhesin transport system outer membrane protein
MVDDGAADEAEYQQAKDIHVILENMIADYTGQLRTAEAYYTELTGNIPAEELVVPAPRADLIPDNVEDAVAYAKQKHPALVAADLMAKSAAYDTKAEEGTLSPDVDGEFSYYESDKKEALGGEVTDGRGVVRLNWDFDTGGAQFARIQQKKLKEKQAASQVQELERQVERAIRLAYADYQKANEQADSQDKRHALNQKLFDTYNVQFEGARITLLQLMQSDNQLFTTDLEKMNASFRVLAARYAILAGMGRLRESLGTTDVAQTAVPAQKAMAPLTGPSADEQK